MKHAILVSVFLLAVTFNWAQQKQNIELVAQVNDYPQEQYNDVWGYVDKNGLEYAIIGSGQATVIYSLKDPSEPEEVAYIPGARSIWRDIKSFGDFLYVTTDQGADGLLVIDMSKAPAEITHSFWKPVLPINNNIDPLKTCHNLNIDENGFAYLSGCNLNDGGIIIVDVGTTPGQPVFVAAADARYSHDNFSRDDKVWSADISVGYFSVIDVKEKNNPVTIATQTTSSRFTHNCWLSDDGQYLFTTDERPNAYVDAYDVSDLDNIRFLDKFQPEGAEGKGYIPHNVHYHNGFLITSWYTEGIVITDANRPNQLIQVGQYDTYELPGSGFDGCWGAYPFLPSGLILASDISNGLFVLKPTYVRACYLMGNVVDLLTNDPLDQVEVSISLNNAQTEFTDVMGNYNTGVGQAGTYEIRFFKPGYNPAFTNVTLQNGVVTVANIKLEPANTHAVNGKVIDAETNEPIPNAQVVFQNEIYNYTTVSDLDGNFEIRGIVEATYDIYAGRWGYFEQSRSTFGINNSETLNFALSKGYQDDFVFDFGWETASVDATSGFWTLGNPIGTDFFGEIANPGTDISNDFGNQCYVTGNLGESGSFDDVDNGIVRLISPAMDLTTFKNPSLSFYYWFFNAGGGTPLNDTLIVSIFNDLGDTLVLDGITTITTEWVASSSYELNGQIPLTATMRVMFETSDFSDSGHILEAGIDGFLVQDAIVSSDNPQQAETLAYSRIYPNPFDQSFTLELPEQDDFRIRVFNLMGQAVENRQVNGKTVLGQEWISGTYFIGIFKKGRLVGTKKVIKQQ